MKLATEVSELGIVVDEIYSRLLPRQYHETIFKEVPFRGVAPHLAGLCPNHKDNEPLNLLIDGTRPTWRCLSGCGKGTWLRWLQMREGLTFWQALEKLALASGIDLRSYAHYSRWRAETELSEFFEKCLAFFQRELESERGLEVRKYLAGRRLSSAECRALEAGAFTTEAAFRSFLEAAKFENQFPLAAERVGSLGARLQTQSLGSSRLVFPVRDEVGRIFTLFTRSIDLGAKAGSKYESISRDLDERRALYNLWTLHETDHAILVEGAMDCVRATAAGFDNVVALGGANILSHHTEILKRRGIRRITLVPDNDKTAFEHLPESVDKLVQSEIDCRVALLPAECKDLDQLLSELGAVGKEIFREAIQSAKPALEWRAELLLSKDQTDGIQSCLRYASHIPRPEDRLTFLHSVVIQSGSALSAFESAIDSFAAQRVPQLLQEKYLALSAECAHALTFGSLEDFESARQKLSGLRQKLP